jgi:serine/threonine protein phosphatase PrpC
MEVYKFIRQGLSHKKRNIECQDCLSYKYLEDGTLILGLSDGAGSAKYAKEASTSNVNAIIRFFSKNSVEDFIELEKEEQINQILSYCFNELSESAKAIGDLNVREYSATLLFTVIKENTIIYGHIGDGAIYAVDKEYKCCYFSEPENKDSSRKTYFTVSQNASEHLYIDVMTGVDE